MAAQEINLLDTNIRPILMSVSIADEGQLRTIDGALTQEGQIDLPAALQRRVTIMFHKNSEYGHIGCLKPA
jgi:hypothetical protein